ncbi:Protein F48G7.5, partial [Aphelenchoides avenae]
TSNCVDLSQGGRPSDCPNVAYLCNNNLYKDLMRVQCPKTCGLCGTSGSGASGANRGTNTNTGGAVPVTVNPGCSDKTLPGKTSDCPQVRYLCNNATYMALMRDQCPKTCGFCT